MFLFENTYLVVLVLVLGWSALFYVDTFGTFASRSFMYAQFFARYLTGRIWL